MRTLKFRSLFIASAVLLAGCHSGNVANAPGTPTAYKDPGTRGLVTGVGIESQDIRSMTDKMMRDMMTEPGLVGRLPAPQVLIDATLFENQSSQRINKRLITTRLRSGLQKAAKGRMVFVSRRNLDAILKERKLKRRGKVDVGTTGFTRGTAGVDFQLRGEIMDQTKQDPNTGAIERYNMINFEMLDMERGTVVWSGLYEFVKAGQNDAIYR